MAALSFRASSLLATRYQLLVRDCSRAVTAAGAPAAAPGGAGAAPGIAAAAAPGAAGAAARQVLRGVMVAPRDAAADRILACLASSWLGGRVLSSDRTCGWWVSRQV
jgi:hypothetical protein